MKIILLSRHFKSMLRCTGAPAYKTVCFPSKYSLKIFGNCDYQLTKFDEYKLKNYYFGLRCLLLLTPFIFKSDAKCFLPCYFKIASLWLADQLFFFLHPHAKSSYLVISLSRVYLVIMFDYIYKLCMWFFSLPVVFCFFYAVHGILREREFELYAYIAGIVVLLSYICIDLIVNKDRRYKLKWVSMTQFWFI